jgi:2-dehydro-3-deoxygluconokinase
MTLQIPVREGFTLDLLSLGALVVRLDPGLIPFHHARQYQIHVSGGEYNVAANLSACFDLRTGIASAIVDYPIGQLVSDQVRATGVRGFYRSFQHDGVTGPNIATVYSDQGFGVRPPVVFYNRANEAAALLQPGDFDWAAIFAEGVRWFHTGGIFASLSDTTPALVIEAMKAARTSGAIVSFDLNYRPKLWAARGGIEQAQRVLRGIVEHVDVLVGNEEDLQNGLGIAGPDDTETSRLDPARFVQMIGQVVTRYPGLRLVATTLREVRSANLHVWSAVAWTGGSVHIIPATEIQVLDRVGGGDGFASGLFYGLLEGFDVDEALRYGSAHGALVATFLGDTTMATLPQVRAVAEGGRPRIQR